MSEKIDQTGAEELSLYAEVEAAETGASAEPFSSVVELVSGPEGTLIALSAAAAVAGAVAIKKLLDMNPISVTTEADRSSEA